tara:strand:- start:110 stop:733 length:624 start_codon:yes stop_codon:yes gene_type:complete
MYAVPSLDEGLIWASDTFGVDAAYGGEHVGLGTRNALISLGSTYLEIIAPDPAQSIKGTLGEKLEGLSHAGLVTWCAEGDLNCLTSKLSELEVATAGPNKTKRQTTGGSVMEWELLFPSKSAFGGCFPFFIDWLDCKNPKDSNPVAGEFKSLSISSPDSKKLKQVLRTIGLQVPVAEGESSVSVMIQGNKGPVSLSSTHETSQINFR